MAAAVVHGAYSGQDEGHATCRECGQLIPSGASVTAAAGHDVTPGHDELHHYWTIGEGKARWSTWTELRDQLVEHVGPVKAAVYASAWFRERFGFWSGNDLNRVKNGKPPRGKVVGPG